MDAHDIPDSTDWLNTPLAGLSSLENALHCQICKEFFDTPMITSCSHTFCSKCIRIAISTDGCCPACRTPDQASKLRNNWQLQEVVATFNSARPEALRVAREQQQTLEAELQRPSKRKRVILDSDNVESESVGRTTRSKSRRLEHPQVSQSNTEEDIEDEVVSLEEPLDDGLVECPLGCGQRMQIDQVEPHLDKCEDERQAREQAAARLKKPPASSRPQDRLNELNYSMMKEKDLSKKMKELGIPTVGTKQLMIRRHTAWVNIWNANCDSSSPRNKRELLRDLDVWERTQGGGAPTVTNGIMKKDFDGNGWSKRNQDDFSKLIANARRTKAKAAEVKEQEKVDEATAIEGDEKTAEEVAGVQIVGNAASGFAKLAALAENEMAHTERPTSAQRSTMDSDLVPGSSNPGVTTWPLVNRGPTDTMTPPPHHYTPSRADKVMMNGEVPNTQESEVNSTSKQPPMYV